LDPVGEYAPEADVHPVVNVFICHWVLVVPTELQAGDKLLGIVQAPSKFSEKMVVWAFVKPAKNKEINRK
jgi:hypothetical protein